MTSVADTHPDADDDLSEISPELVLVDPELAKRLREREPAPVEDPRPTPVLRLVSAAASPAPVESVDSPPAAVENVDAPAPAVSEPVTTAAETHDPSEPEAVVPSEPEAVVAPAEPETVVPQPSLEPPIEEMIVPRTVPADGFVMREAEPATDAEPLAVETRQVFPPRAPSPPARRRGRLLRFVLAAAIASVAVIAILSFTGTSPLPTTGVSSFPVAGDGTPDAATPAPAPTSGQPAAQPKKPAAQPKKPTKRPATQTPSASKPKSSAKSTAKPATKPKSGAVTKKPAATATEPRRFAWAPVDGASSYHVELFRGSDRVFAGDTKQPVLELGPTWRHQGRVMKLTDGTYRWYVWSVTASGRSAQAIVQATLSIP